MSANSKVLPFELKNKPQLEEVNVEGINHKTHNCKRCGSTALKEVGKNPVDRFINILLPTGIFQCYSCGRRNRFLNESVRSTFTLISLSLLVATGVIFAFNKAFEPKLDASQVSVKKQIITPVLESIEAVTSGVELTKALPAKQQSLSDSFDLSFRVPPVFSAGILSANPIKSAAESIPAIEMDLSTELVVAVQEPEKATVAKVQLDLPKPKALDNLSDKVVAPAIKKALIPVEDRYYSVEFLRNNNADDLSKRAKNLASNPEVDEPMMLMNAQGEQVLFYGIYRTEEQALSAAKKLPSDLVGIAPTVLMVNNLPSKLILLD